MALSNEDFRLDEGGKPGWDYQTMLAAGRDYLELPVPRTLLPVSSTSVAAAANAHFFDRVVTNTRRQEIEARRDGAGRLLGYVSPEIIAFLASTEVGIGTDPERQEQSILNKKKQVLQRSTFATCLCWTGLLETVQAVHTFTEESLQQNGKNLDLGVTGSFQGVQLGFEAASETGTAEWKGGIVAIADLRYKWAATESRIHRNKLCKYLTRDCQDALGLLQMSAAGDMQQRQAELARLAKSLSSFFDKYGTHVVLRCTHGYRLEKVEKTTQKTGSKLRAFKAGMMASVLNYAGLTARAENEALAKNSYIESSLGIRNIGSIHQMKRAINEDIPYEEMMRYACEGGGAGVISHDWCLKISTIIGADTPGNPQRGTSVSDRIDYWTYVRINDLKAGWTEDLFAVSCLLQFSDTGTQKNHDDESESVCVSIGGRTTVHNYPTKRPYQIGYITNVHRDERDAGIVQLSTLNGSPLSNILREVTVFYRYLEDDGIRGTVLATKVPLPRRKEAEMEYRIFHMETYLRGQALAEGTAGHDWMQHVDRMSIGQARAKVCWRSSKQAL